MRQAKHAKTARSKQMAVGLAVAAAMAVGTAAPALAAEPGAVLADGAVAEETSAETGQADTEALQDSDQRSNTEIDSDNQQIVDKNEGQIEENQDVTDNRPEESRPVEEGEEDPAAGLEGEDQEELDDVREELDQIVGDEEEVPLEGEETSSADGEESLEGGEEKTEEETPPSLSDAENQMSDAASQLILPDPLPVGASEEQKAAYEEAVAAYNAAVEAYNQGVDAYNDAAGSYNDAMERYNALAQKNNDAVLENNDITQNDNQQEISGTEEKNNETAEKNDETVKDNGDEAKEPLPDAPALEDPIPELGELPAAPTDEELEKMSAEEKNQYVDAYNQVIAEYNAALEAFKAADGNLEAYNQAVAAYNEAVEAYNKTVSSHNAGQVEQAEEQAAENQETAEDNLEKAAKDLEQAAENGSFDGITAKQEANSATITIPGEGSATTTVVYHLDGQGNVSSVEINGLTLPGELMDLSLPTKPDTSGMSEEEAAAAMEAYAQSLEKYNSDVCQQLEEYNLAAEEYNQAVSAYNAAVRLYNNIVKEYNSEAESGNKEVIEGAEGDLQAAAAALEEILSGSAPGGVTISKENASFAVDGYLVRQTEDAIFITKGGETLVLSASALDSASTPEEYNTALTEYQKAAKAFNQALQAYNQAVETQNNANIAENQGIQENNYATAEEAFAIMRGNQPMEDIQIEKDRTGNVVAFTAGSIRVQMLDQDTVQVSQGDKTYLLPVSALTTQDEIEEYKDGASLYNQALTAYNEAVREFNKKASSANSSSLTSDMEKIQSDLKALAQNGSFSSSSGSAAQTSNGFTVTMDGKTYQVEMEKDGSGNIIAVTVNGKTASASTLAAAESGDPEYAEAVKLYQQAFGAYNQLIGEYNAAIQDMNDSKMSSEAEDAKGNVQKAQDALDKINAAKVDGVLVSASSFTVTGQFTDLEGHTDSVTYTVELDGSVVKVTVKDLEGNVVSSGIVDPELVADASDADYNIQIQKYNAAVGLYNDALNAYSAAVQAQNSDHAQANADADAANAEKLAADLSQIALNGQFSGVTVAVDKTGQVTSFAAGGYTVEVLQDTAGSQVVRIKDGKSTYTLSAETLAALETGSSAYNDAAALYNNAIAAYNAVVTGYNDGQIAANQTIVDDNDKKLDPFAVYSSIEEAQAVLDSVGASEEEKAEASAAKEYLEKKAALEAAMQALEKAKDDNAAIDGYNQAVEAYKKALEAYAEQLGVSYNDAVAEYNETVKAYNLGIDNTGAQEDISGNQQAMEENNKKIEAVQEQLKTEGEFIITDAEGKDVTSATLKILNDAETLTNAQKEVQEKKKALEGYVLGEDNTLIGITGEGGALIKADQMSAEQIQAYNDAVEAYNQKVDALKAAAADYNNARELYNSAVESYNQQYQATLVKVQNSLSSSEKVAYGNVFQNKTTVGHIDVKLDGAQTYGKDALKADEGSSGVEILDGTAESYTIIGIYTDQSAYKPGSTDYGLTYQTSASAACATSSLTKDANNEFAHVTFRGEAFSLESGNVAFYAVVQDSSGETYKMQVVIDSKTVYPEGTVYGGVNFKNLANYRINGEALPVVKDQSGKVIGYDISGLSVYEVSLMTCDGFRWETKGSGSSATCTAKPDGLDLVLSVETLKQQVDKYKLEQLDPVAYASKYFKAALNNCGDGTIEVDGCLKTLKKQADGCLDDDLHCDPVEDCTQGDRMSCLEQIRKALAGSISGACKPKNKELVDCTGKPLTLSKRLKDLLDCVKGELTDCGFTEKKEELPSGDKHDPCAALETIKTIEVCFKSSVCTLDEIDPETLEPLDPMIHFGECLDEEKPLCPVTPICPEYPQTPDDGDCDDKPDCKPDCKPICKPDCKPICKPICTPEEEEIKCEIISCLPDHVPEVPCKPVPVLPKTGDEHSSGGFAAAALASLLGLLGLGVDSRKKKQQ